VISPAESFRAEDHWLIVPIGLGDPRGLWRAAHWPTCPRCVNVSAVQFHRVRSTKDILRALADSGLPRTGSKSRLRIDFPRRWRATLRLPARLCTLGVRIALDDFGTLFVAQLFAELPVRQAQDHRRFIQTADPRWAIAIVHAITELAMRRMETTAEGVEETAQLMELRPGCSSVQGYLFAEPMSAADVERLFSEGSRRASERRLGCRSARGSARRLVIEVQAVSAIVTRISALVSFNRGRRGTPAAASA